MKAIVFPARDQVTCIDLPDPIAGPGEVVVRVHASGICHTDYEVLYANYGTGAFPVVPGHEYAGVIAEVGPGVEGLSEGDRVVVDPNIECGTCSACKRGWAHLCEALEAYGVTRHGGFAEYSVVGAGAVHKLDDMPFETAALAEPMGCVLNGLDAVRTSATRNALVFGAGPMGLLLGIGLKARGVETVDFVDLDTSRLDRAAAFGFGGIEAGSEVLADRRQTQDLVVDATGVPAVAGGLTGYAANGGSVLFFGVCPSDARIEVSPFEVFRRQLTLAGSHSLNHNIPEALQALRSFDGSLEALVSHRLSLEETAAILSAKLPPGSLKVQAQIG